MALRRRLAEFSIPSSRRRGPAIAHAVRTLRFAASIKAPEGEVRAIKRLRRKRVRPHDLLKQACFWSPPDFEAGDAPVDFRLDLPHTR